MEDLQHDLLPGRALQSSQCGDTGLAWATVRVSRAVVSVLQLWDSARPQVGPAHWGGQTCLTRLGTVNMLTAGLTCRYQSDIYTIPQYISLITPHYTTLYHTISHHTTPQYTTAQHSILQDSVTSIEGLLGYLAGGGADHLVTVEVSRAVLVTGAGRCQGGG